MPSSAKTVQKYLKELPADRREAINAVRGVILANLPNEYEECMSYLPDRESVRGNRGSENEKVDGKGQPFESETHQEESSEIR